MIYILILIAMGGYPSYGISITRAAEFNSKNLCEDVGKRWDSLGNKDHVCLSISPELEINFKAMGK